MANASSTGCRSGIATANKYDAAGTKFLEGHILKHIVNGRIHAEIHPFRADEGGTRSSRFSYSNPPLQQMPVRDKEMGPLIRSVFLPEEGEIWAKPDAAQQEFRWLVHYAVQHGLRGAAEAADDLSRQSGRRLPRHGRRDDRARSRARPRASISPRSTAPASQKMAEMIGKPVDGSAGDRQLNTIAKLPFVAKLAAVAQETAVAHRLSPCSMTARGGTGIYTRWPRIYAKGAGPCGIEEARRRIADPEHPWFGRRLSRAKTYTA